MKLINNGTNPLAHGTYKLPKGGVAEIPNNIAKEWVKIRGVKQYVEAADLAQASQKADAEKKALQDEIAKLKAELTDLKKAAKETDKDLNLEELKKEAESLGIQYAPNISTINSEEKIDATKAEKTE